MPNFTYCTFSVVGLSVLALSRYFTPEKIIDPTPAREEPKIPKMSNTTQIKLSPTSTENLERSPINATPF